jgi:hypothetical protein
MPRHTIFLSDDVARRIAFDKELDRGFSARISYLCVLASDLMKEATPTFALSEWCAMLDIANGAHSMYDGRTPAGIADGFSFSIHESGSECDNKWKIKCTELAAKYRALPVASQLSALEICRKFWVLPEIAAKFSNYRDALTAHGAQFAD